MKGEDLIQQVVPDKEHESRTASGVVCGMEVELEKQKYIKDGEVKEWRLTARSEEDWTTDMHLSFNEAEERFEELVERYDLEEHD